MENASKALLIAGGVLVAIVIITLAVILYTIFSNSSKKYNEIRDITEIQKFNSKFDVYIGRDDITAQEIISVVNLAQEYNGLVDVEVYNKSNILQTYTNSENFVKEFFNKTFKYIETKYDDIGKISKIIFRENLE